MSYHVDIQIIDDRFPVPNQFIIHRWVTDTLTPHIENAELCIRIVDETESAALNAQYRFLNKPTNVLSFPTGVAPELRLEREHLGDLVICAAIIEKEALAQHKKVDAHWAHIITHGLLHLLGYDHITDEEADEMESLEIELLHKWGFPNPYEDDETDE